MRSPTGAPKASAAVRSSCEPAQLGGILAAILVVITLIFSPLIVEHLFDGYWLLLVGFLLGLVGYYAGHLGRGTFSGMGRFGAYGLYMGGEGVIRMALCVALAAVGVHTVGLYGLAVGIPPLIAVSIAVRRERNLIEPGPEAPFSEVSSNLGWLLAGSVLAAFMINAGPIAVTLLATPSEESLAGKFTTSTVIARVPLFLFQAVQASLLPKLALLVGAGRFHDFRAGFRRLLTAVAGLGVVAVIGAFLIGPSRRPHPLRARLRLGPSQPDDARCVERALHAGDHDVAGDHRLARSRSRGDRVARRRRSRSSP